MRRARGWRLLAAGIAALAGGLALAVAPASAREREFAVSERPALDDIYPERAARFPGGVRGLADVVYSTVPGYRPAILDIYAPRERRPKPLIVYVHGGGWVAGHTRHSGAISDFPLLLASLAREGFVVASVEYRLAREAAFPAQIQDVRAAIRFLKANAARYGIDPTRVAVWGGSAGGHLAALAATSCSVGALDAEAAPAGSECVQGAAVWYGVFDFAPVIASLGEGAAQSPIPLLLRCDAAAVCPGYEVAAASPVSYVDSSDPPFLLIHGEEDKTVPVAQSRQMEARLRAAGVSVEALYFPNADHSFIGAAPADTRALTLRAVNATFDFFHRVLDQPAP